MNNPDEAIRETAKETTNWLGLPWRPSFELADFIAVWPAVLFKFPPFYFLRLPLTFKISLVSLTRIIPPCLILHILLG